MTAEFRQRCQRVIHDDCGAAFGRSLRQVGTTPGGQRYGNEVVTIASVDDRHKQLTRFDGASVDRRVVDHSIRSVQHTTGDLGNLTGRHLHGASFASFEPTDAPPKPNPGHPYPLRSDGPSI